MANNVRYTAAKRREVKAARIAEFIADMRRLAAMDLDAYRVALRPLDCSTDEEFAAWTAERHPEVVAAYGPHVADADLPPAPVHL